MWLRRTECVSGLGDRLYKPQALAGEIAQMWCVHLEGFLHLEREGCGLGFRVHKLNIQ